MQTIKSRLTFMVVLIFLAGPATAQENFYSGKIIRVIVGYAPATTTDQWARIFARHAPKYVPGNPTLVVQNVAGASSMIAANQIYSLAKPDGLTIGFIAPALYFDQTDRTKGSPVRLGQVRLDR